MNAVKPTYPPKEMQLLGVLKEIQPILGSAVNSLGGKKPPTPASSYLGQIAASLNRAADGYLLLREAYRVDASKLLVRPALEVVFAGTAAVQNREFIFRKAYTEWEDDKKLFARTETGKKEAENFIEGFKRTFAKKCTGFPIKCERITVQKTAEMAGLLSVYEDAYRVYCKFTHSALRAVTKGLDEATDEHDTSTVIWCVLIMLDQLKKHTPAQVPDLAQFNAKLTALNSQ